MQSMEWWPLDMQTLIKGKKLLMWFTSHSYLVKKEFSSVKMSIYSQLKPKPRLSPKCLQKALLTLSCTTLALAVDNKLWPMDSLRGPLEWLTLTSFLWPGSLCMPSILYISKLLLVLLRSILGLRYSGISRDKDWLSLILNIGQMCSCEYYQIWIIYLQTFHYIN